VLPVKPEYCPPNTHSSYNFSIIHGTLKSEHVSHYITLSKSSPIPQCESEGKEYLSTTCTLVHEYIHTCMHKTQALESRVVPATIPQNSRALHRASAVTAALETLAFGAANLKAYKLQVSVALLTLQHVLPHKHSLYVT
jgi:hypothetical protein